MHLMKLLPFILLGFSSLAAVADWGDAAVLNPSFAGDNRFSQSLDLSGNENSTPQDLPDWAQDLILYQMRIDKFGEQPTINSARQKLFTLQELGITGVVLNPVAKCFKGLSWDGFEYWNFYSHTEPDQLEPALGTDADFAALVDELHAMGIKVFLDFEFHGVFDPDVFKTKMNWIAAYNDTYPQDRSSLLDSHPEFFKWIDSDDLTTPEADTIHHPVYSDYNSAELVWSSNGIPNTALMEWYKGVLVTNWIAKFDLDGLRLDLEPFRVAEKVGYNYWDDVRALAKQATGRDIVLIPEDGNFDRAKSTAFAFAQEDFGVSNPRVAWGNFVKDFMVSEHLTDYPQNNPEFNLTVDPSHIVDVAKGWNGNISRDETFYSSAISVHDNHDYTSDGHWVYFGYGTLFQPFIPFWFMGNEFNVRNLAAGYDQYHNRIYFNRLTWADRTANQAHLNAVRKMIYIRKKYKNLIGPSTHRLKDKPMVKVPVVGIQPDLPGYGYFNPSGDPVGIVVLGTKATAVGAIRIKLPLVHMRLHGHALYAFHNLMADTVTMLAPVNGDEFDLPDSLDAWDNLIYKIEPADGAIDPPPGHTVSHWRFEEGTAGQAHPGDLDGFYRDLSGYGNHLSSVVAGSRPSATSDLPFATVPQVGAVNKLALDFNSGTRDELGTVGRMLDSHAFTNGWTVEASFKPSALNWKTILSKDGKPTNLGESPFQMKIRDDSKKMQVAFFDNAASLKWLETKALSVGRWYSVAATYDNATFKLYLKGEGDADYLLQGIVAVPAGADLNPMVGNWSVGRGMWSGNPSDFFSGQLDEVRVSNVALDPQDFLGAAVAEHHDFDSDGMADAWELEYFDSIAECAPEGNPDADELDTFFEYALGGDPTLHDAATFLPNSFLSSEWLTYVYNRRRDAAARGLTYGLQESHDLLGDWTSVGTAYETNSAVIDLEFESVTNQIDITGSGQGFVQLEISGR